MTHCNYSFNFFKLKHTFNLIKLILFSLTLKLFHVVKKKKKESLFHAFSYILNHSLHMQLYDFDLHSLIN